MGATLVSALETVLPPTPPPGGGGDVPDDEAAPATVVPLTEKLPVVAETVPLSVPTSVPVLPESVRLPPTALADSVKVIA